MPVPWPSENCGCTAYEPTGSMERISTACLPVCSTSCPGPWPRTSADGEYTRRNSYGRRKVLPSSKAISSTRDFWCSLISVGTALMGRKSEGGNDSPCQHVIRHRLARRRGPSRRRPDRIGKVRIVGEARDHVPVHMRHDVSQACKVDLVGPVELAQRRLAGEHRLHQPVTFGEVGHFLDVAIDDHAQETRIALHGGPHHAAEVVAPDHCAAIGVAELAAHSGVAKTSR